MRNRRLYLPALIAGLTVIAMSLAVVVDAAVVVTTTTNVAPSGAVHDPYDPSTDTPASGPMMTASSVDLIQGATPTVTYTGGTGSTTEEESAGVATWTDGSLATVYAQGGNGGDAIDHAAYGSVNATIGDGGLKTFVTYDLGALYTLSSVDVYMGWNDSGRDDSSFNLLVSEDGVTYTTIASYDKGGDNTGAIGEPITNLHSIAEMSGGDLADNARYVQLHFTDADNGWAGMVELDVFGAEVPEPSTWALIVAGLVTAGAMSRRR